jgi:site-specific DNA recombinase
MESLGVGPRLSFYFLERNSKNQHQVRERQVPMRFRRRGVEAKLVILGRQLAASEPDINLVKALARAHEWWRRIARGEARGIGDVARAEGFNRAYVTRFLCLAFLAPEITTAILEGRQPTELTAKRLISLALKVPLLWPDQIDLFRC